jgi:hypothetical protein
MSVMFVSLAPLADFLGPLLSASPYLRRVHRFLVLACYQHRDPSTYFAFIVGNNAYAHLGALAKSVKDAEDMRDMLIASGYPHDHVFTVLDESHAIFQDQLTKFVRRLDGAEGNHVVFYYAGHGNEGDGGETILMPVDADLSSHSRTCSWASNPSTMCRLNP